MPGPRCALPLLGTLALLAGCSGSVDVDIGKRVPEDQVERNAQAALSAKVGSQAPPIDCPDDLGAKVGEQLTCTTELDGKPYDVTVEVTSVEGGDVKFDVQVADEPRR